MENNIIDEKTRTFLIACLITGIDVKFEKIEFMHGLVSHINSSERIFWALGDEDGIIIHDEHDQPIVSLIYTGTKLTFRTFEKDEFTAIDTQKSIGFALLSTIAYINFLELDFCPSVLGSEAYVTRQGIEVSDDTSDTNPEDWAL